jgi:hypothetical protein
MRRTDEGIITAAREERCDALNDAGVHGLAAPSVAGV